MSYRCFPSATVRLTVQCRNLRHHQQNKHGADVTYRVKHRHVRQATAGEIL